jgi:hypothetical protein
MNLAHIHIVLNHLPTLGILAGLGLLAWALVTRNPTVERNSLVLLLVCGLLIVPTYLTGNAADGSIRSRDDIPRTLVEAHQDSAMLTLAFMTLTGTFAWLGLWQFRRFSRQTGWNAAAVMILTPRSGPTGRLPKSPVGAPPLRRWSPIIRGSGRRPRRCTSSG